MAELLLNKGYEVHGIKRRASSFNTSRINHLYEDPHENNTKFKLHYGDLTDSTNLIKNSQKADVLFHEAISYDLTRRMSKTLADLGEEFDINIARYGSKIFTDIESYHATPIEVAEIASLSNVDMLVYYHLIPTPQPPIDKIITDIFFQM